MRLSAQHTAFLFPGQGSQKVGMGRELAQTYTVAREVFEEADETLGFALSKLAWEGPADALNDTLNTQPALLVHSVAALRVLQDMYPKFQPAYVAGHSMGELSALVGAGALPFPAALQLVRRRGELMKQAGELAPGGMAAILGLDIPTLEQICAEASTGAEIVQVANDNCPGQVVISGSRQGLERAVQLAKEARAWRVVTLAVSIAAHSPLMAQSQARFNKAVAEAPLSEPKIPLVGNVNAKPITTILGLQEDLKAQLTSRVRWTESIQFMQAQGVTSFLEIGSGAVLCGLLKRIDRGLERIPIGEPGDYSNIQSG